MSKFAISLRIVAVAVLIAAVGAWAASVLPAEDSQDASDVGTKVVAKAGELPEANWHLFRGSSESRGVSASTLPAEPEILWQKKLAGESFKATAAIVDGVIYQGGFDALYAFKLADGTELWKFPSKTGFDAAAAVQDGRVYSGDLEGNFYCFDAKTGDVKWTFEASAEINSGANFYKDMVLVGAHDGNLYCLKADDGSLVWKYGINEPIQCFPTIVGNRGFVAGCDGRLHIVNLDDGKGLATVPFDAPTLCTAAVQGDRVYVGTTGDSVYCIDWKKAEVAWTYKSASLREPRSSAAVTAGVLVIGGRGKNVIGLNPKDGEELWTAAVQGDVDSSPVIVGDVAYVGSTRGRLYGIDIKTGDILWEFQGGDFGASPAVAGGKMVIGNMDGVLYCFGKK